MATKETDRDRSADVRSATDRKSLGNYCVKLSSPDKAPVRSRTQRNTTYKVDTNMATIQFNSFTQFQQTEHEQLSGTLLSNEQKQFIQNNKAQIAEQRLALVPDPQSYSAFIQQEAYLKGQMDFAQHLLDSSIASEQAVKDAQQEQQS
jgi:hypothetical protein